MALLDFYHGFRNLSCVRITVYPELYFEMFDSLESVALTGSLQKQCMSEGEFFEIIVRKMVQNVVIFSAGIRQGKRSWQLVVVTSNAEEVAYKMHLAAENEQTTGIVSKSQANIKLQQAYVALQAWKRVIYSDPRNFTSDWNGPDVCKYTGVYCSPHPKDTSILVVAGIDLNHGDIAGYLPEKLGLLSELAFLHLNSNRFCGILPRTLSKLSLLFELDLSNNGFVGPFPTVVLSLPSLNYLDMRFNKFEGKLPPQLFTKNIDAIFINNNHFTSVIPSNVGSTTASVLVFSNNQFEGCFPPSIISLAANNLEELLLINSSISGCLPIELGYLNKLRVLDLSFNQIVGHVPYSLTGLSHLEVLNLGHNRMSGTVPQGVCSLPKLSNFAFSDNFFVGEEGICRNLTSRRVMFDDHGNCLPEKSLQRSKKECEADEPANCF